LHSFFAWAEAEDLIEIDPSRKIRRPPKRKPDVYRPSLDELAAVRRAALPHELPAILLMEGAGLRRSEVLACRWADLDLVRGRVRAFRKGSDWHWLPLDPDVIEGLRASFRLLQPELDDHTFTAEVEQWVSQFERVRRLKDPKVAASDQALWRMVRRVCKRAGVRELSPHQLRHGFANRFMRESGRDVAALKGLLGHSRVDTTEAYTDEIELDELADALAKAADVRHAQASPDWTTLGRQTLRNPRNPLMEAAGIEPAQSSDRDIACCYVGKGRRRQGVAPAALVGAVDLIAGLGGGTVEGYPEDAGSVPAGFLFNGALSTYDKLGFERDRKIGKHRWGDQSRRAALLGIVP
jgi:site-specific recombinase XerD